MSTIDIHVMVPFTFKVDASSEMGQLLDDYSPEVLQRAAEYAVKRSLVTAGLPAVNEGASWGILSID